MQTRFTGLLLVLCVLLGTFASSAAAQSIPTPAPAHLVAAIDSATPFLLTSFNDTLIFGVRHTLVEVRDPDGVLQPSPLPNDELWTSDGTQSGTYRITTITTDVGNFSNLRQIVRVQQSLFLSIHYGIEGGHDIPGGELWRSDGTADGTRRIERLSIEARQEVQQIGSANNALFVGGASLWHTSDLAADPISFETLHGFPCSQAYFGCTSSLRQLTSVDNRLFFVVNDASQPALWVTDGTPSGTHLLKAFASTTCDTLERLLYACQTTPYDLTAVNGRLFFIADDGNGAALWQSDGMAAGTVRATPIPLPAGVLPHHLIAVPGSNTLLFTTNTPEAGSELWMSDGTSAGTRMVQDLNPGSQSANPDQLTVVGTTLFFTADDGIHGVGLWSVPLTPQADAATFVTPRATPVQSTLSGRALPGTALTYRISTPPAHGTTTITDAATGAFRYTPSSDFRGTDSFQFIVNDSAPATVTMSVGNYRQFVPLVAR